MINCGIVTLMINLPSSLPLHSLSHDRSDSPTLRIMLRAGCSDLQRSSHRTFSYPRCLSQRGLSDSEFPSRFCLRLMTDQMSRIVTYYLSIPIFDPSDNHTYPRPSLPLDALNSPEQIPPYPLGNLILIPRNHRHTSPTLNAIRSTPNRSSSCAN